MKIEIKESGLIKLTTEKDMFEMDRDQLTKIEKASEAVRYLVDVLNVKTLTLETK